MTDILERLQSDGEGERQQFREARATLGSLLNEAAAEIERLRAALEPFASLFLFPEDLAFEYAEDIRADADWDEDSNDAQTDNVFVLRRDIRRARAALEGK